MPCIEDTYCNSKKIYRPSACPGNEIAFGTISNQTIRLANLSPAPAPLIMDVPGLMQNMRFAPGTLTTVLPGAYEISYSLNIAFDSFFIDNIATVQAANPTASTGPAIDLSFIAEAISAVTLNGVPLESSYYYVIDSESFYGISMQKSTIVQLPEETHIGMALWTGRLYFCSDCYYIYLPGASLTVKRLGEGNDDSNSLL